MPKAVACTGYRGPRGECAPGSHTGRPSRLEMMVGDEHRDNPVVSVLDGHSLALSFLGGAPGTDQFGRSGLPHEVYDAPPDRTSAHQGGVSGGFGVRLQPSFRASLSR